MNFFINSKHWKQYEKVSDFIVIIIIVSVIIIFMPIFRILCGICFYVIAFLFVFFIIKIDKIRDKLMFRIIQTLDIRFKHKSIP
jgi:hypothetical protein